MDCRIPAGRVSGGLVAQPLAPGGAGPPDLPVERCPACARPTGRIALPRGRLNPYTHRVQLRLAAEHLALQTEAREWLRSNVTEEMEAFPYSEEEEPDRLRAFNKNLAAR